MNRWLFTYVLAITVAGCAFLQDQALKQAASEKYKSEQEKCIQDFAERGDIDRCRSLARADAGYAPRDAGSKPKPPLMPDDGPYDAAPQSAHDAGADQ